MLHFKRILLLTLCFLLLSPDNKGFESGISMETAQKNSLFNSFTELIYSNIESCGISVDAFKKGIQGYLSLKQDGKLVNTDVLTIVDFSKSANQDRLFVFDMNTWTIREKMLVSHGRNTGEEYAKTFSNTPGSYTSSLGFYTTAEVYDGKHGMSMRLDGLEPGFNDKARERAIVIHSADYVSESFINQNGRLGRSQGCPAVSADQLKSLLNSISNKSCLFVYFPDKKYISKSRILSNHSYLESFSQSLIQS